MKRFLLFFTALLALCPAFAQSLFDSVADMPGVSSTYISNEFLSNTGTSSGAIYLNGASIPAENYRSLEIISADEDSSTKPEVVAAACRKIIDGMDLELLLRTRDDDGYNRIYVGRPDGNNSSKIILIESKDEDSYQLVYMRGEFDVKELARRYSNLNLNM